MRIFASGFVGVLGGYVQTRGNSIGAKNWWPPGKGEGLGGGSV